MIKNTLQVEIINGRGLYTLKEDLNKKLRELSDKGISEKTISIDYYLFNKIDDNHTQHVAIITYLEQENI